MSFSRARKGDTVRVLSGKDKGREGKVLRVYPEEDRVLVEGVNMRKRHRRPRRVGEKGSIVQVATPLALSNVMPKCPHCAKPTRIGIKISKDGTKSRICKKCGGEF